MLIKVTLNKEIHLYNGEVSIKSLASFAERTFKNIPNVFTFHYIDEEGDNIMVSSDEDIAMMIPPSGKVMKIFIQEDERYELLPVESRFGNSEF